MVGIYTLPCEGGTMDELEDEWVCDDCGPLTEEDVEGSPPKCRNCGKAALELPGKADKDATDY